MLIYNEQVAITISATEKHDRVVGEAVVQRRKPFHGPRVIKFIDDMHLAPERRKELPSRNIRIANHARFCQPVRFCNTFVYSELFNRLSPTRAGTNRVSVFYREKIIQFANLIKIHPGVIAGQLQHRNEIQWAANRDMLVKVRDILVPVAMTDGWGVTISQRKRL